MTLLLALALDLYLLPSDFFVAPGQAVTVSIHHGDALRDASLITASAVYNITNLRASGQTTIGTAVIKGRGIEVLAVRTAPKTEARERRSEFAKSLVFSEAPDDAYKLSAGHTLEIFPETNPYSLKPGDELPIQVRLRGKPAPDLEVRVARDSGEARIAGRTDSTGRLRVPITAAGKWRLHTIAMERCADPKAADWESYWASLTFAVE